MGKEAATIGSGFIPVLKGRHNVWVKKHMAISIALSISLVLLAKFTINEPRKLKYAEYYK